MARGGAAAGGDASWLSADALVLEGVSRAFGALRAIDDISFSVAVGERRARAGRQRRRQDHAVQRHHRRLPADGRARPLLRRRHHRPAAATSGSGAGLRRTYQSSLLFRDLTVRDNLFLATRGVSRGRFSFLRPRAGASLARRDAGPARTHPPRASADGWSPSCRTASSASSRSAWRWPARRA